MGQYPIRLMALFGIIVILLFQAGCSSDTMSSIITLTISPTTIEADGDETAEITATIIGYDGLPVNIGTSVLFTTSRGMFTIGSKSMTATTTDDTGTVKVYLFAPLGTNRGTALIVVTSGSVSRSGKVEITDYGVPGETAKIELTADPTSIPPDGKTPSVIEATLTDGNGDPVYLGTSMTFTTDKGYFAENGRASITVVTRDVTGIESVNLIAPEGLTGVAQIKCTSNGVIAITTVTLGGAIQITLTVDDDSIPADGETIATITATVIDITGTIVPVGTKVTFEVLHGQFTNGKRSFSDVTDAAGKAVAYFFAPVGTTPRVVQVKVTSMGAVARVPIVIE